MGVSSKRGKGLGVDRSGGSKGLDGGNRLLESGDTRFLLGVEIVGDSFPTSEMLLCLDGSAINVSSTVLDTTEASPLVSDSARLFFDTGLACCLSSASSLYLFF